MIDLLSHKFVYLYLQSFFTFHQKFLCVEIANLNSSKFTNLPQSKKLPQFEVKAIFCYCHKYSRISLHYFFCDQPRKPVQISQPARNKPQPIATCSRAFSRAPISSYVFLLNFHWLVRCRTSLYYDWTLSQLKFCRYDNQLALYLSAIYHLYTRSLEIT